MKTLVDYALEATKCLDGTFHVHKRNAGDFPFKELTGAIYLMDGSAYYEYNVRDNEYATRKLPDYIYSILVLR